MFAVNLMRLRVPPLCSHPTEMNINYLQSAVDRQHIVTKNEKYFITFPTLIAFALSLMVLDELHELSQECT